MLYFTIEKRLQDGIGKVPEAAGARWRFYRRISSDYRRISSDYRRISSDYRRISSNRLSIGGSIQGVSAEILSFKISWQAQYLVRLEGDFTCSTHWKWRFICDADHWWHSFCVAGAVFGEVPGWFCLLRALEMMIHMWRRSLMTFIWCGRRSIWWSWRVTWLAARIGNDVSYVTQSTDDIDFVWQVQYLVRLEGHFVELQDFVAGALFGEVGGWLYLLHALEMTFHMWRRSLMTFILRGRRSIWWGSRLILLAARIGHDDSYVTQIIDDIHLVWQAQYLVKLEGDLTGCAHWKWRFICDAEHWWHWFCVAGAVFGEVGGSFCVAGVVFAEVGVWLFVTGAVLRDILGDSRNAKCCILQ